MSTSDLEARVRAAIEETMRIAREADPHVLNLEGRLWVTNTVEVRGWLWQTEQDHIALHDPASTLRRCEADLRTLDQYDFAANELREMQAEQEKANVVAAMATVILKAVHDALYAVLVDRASAYGVPVDPEGS